MKKKLEEFLELEKKGTPEAIIQRVAQSRTIAPQVVRKLMEAVELLEEFYKSKGAICDRCIDAGDEEICNKCDIAIRNHKTKQFLEDFEND